MSATRRGAYIGLGLIVAIVLCSLLTFSWMPAWGISVGLPHITMPGEAYNGQPMSEAFNWTNTLADVAIVDVLVLLIAFFGWRASKGWTKEVPGRFQSFLELLGDFIYGYTKNFAGVSQLARQWVFPLSASLFLFLLLINAAEMLPVNESVGLMHCARPGISGYPTTNVGGNTYQLFVEKMLDGGTPATEANYEACEHWTEAGGVRPTSTQLTAAADELFNKEGALVQSKASVEEIQALRLEATEALYHEPAVALTSDQIRRGVVPYIQTVTPFVRPASTDMNLTIGLALISMIFVQVMGVAALGPNYFQKFINLNALGNISKNPMGVIDFGVGLFDIITEIFKIISLAFRLFGNLFAGGILLVVMSFLVAALFPVAFYGLELIVVVAQAFVFAVLTIVFSGLAMTGHHSDGEEHHEEIPIEAGIAEASAGPANSH